MHYLKPDRLQRCYAAKPGQSDARINSTALNLLQEDCKPYDWNDLSFLNPYGTRHLKPFGEYRSEFETEA